MSTKRKWIWIYLYVIVAAFAFGLAYDMAYQGAFAKPVCDCALWCPGTDSWESARYWEPYHICGWDPIQCFNCLIPGQ